MATSLRPALLSRQLLAQRTPMALRAFHASPTRAILPPLPQVIKGTSTTQYTHQHHSFHQH